MFDLPPWNANVLGCCLALPQSQTVWPPVCQEVEDCDSVLKVQDSPWMKSTDENVGQVWRFTRSPRRSNPGWSFQSWWGTGIRLSQVLVGWLVGWLISPSYLYHYLPIQLLVDPPIGPRDRRGEVDFSWRVGWPGEGQLLVGANQHGDPDKESWRRSPTGCFKATTWSNWFLPQPAACLFLVPQEKSKRWSSCKRRGCWISQDFANDYH